MADGQCRATGWIRHVPRRQQYFLYDDVIERITKLPTPLCLVLPDLLYYSHYILNMSL